jgi:hypothetical protein
MNYKPVKTKRFFTPDTRYSDIDWNNESVVVDKFQEQLSGWYINPIKALITASAHFGFPVIALTCTLVDTLSQYYFGSERSSQRVFKDFLTIHFPDFAKPFPTPILVDPTKNLYAENYADAIYGAFRCGIVHEAHVSLYGVVAGHTEAVEYIENDSPTLYVDGTVCPSVVLNPEKFFAKIEAVFEQYFDILRNPDPQHDPVRKNFKKKFLASYGIDIGNEH